MDKLILFILLSGALGYLEAILFHLCAWNFKEDFEKRFGNIHGHFIVIRVIIYFFAFGLNYEALMMFIPYVFMFPLFHEGVYHTARKYFTSYKIDLIRFTRKATESNANINLSFGQRICLYLFGLLLAIFLLNSYTTTKNTYKQQDDHHSELIVK